MAQRIQGALIAGFNLSQVDGDEIYGFRKFGLTGGPSAIIPFTEKWLVSLETIFNQKGSFEKKQYYSLDTLGNELNGAYRLVLDYVEVPVMVHFNDRDRITAGLGFSWGRLVRVKEWEHGRRTTSTSLNTGPYDKNDYNILVDLRFRLYKRFRMNFRYAYSLSRIRTREFLPQPGSNQSWTRDQYNNLIGFRLIYVFNEKPPAKEGAPEPVR